LIVSKVFFLFEMAIVWNDCLIGMFRKLLWNVGMGVDQGHAYAFSRTRKGGWAIAQSPILNTTITLKRLKQRGYQSLTDVYIELNPSLCEPPST
jgi:hypothetical protein